MAVHCGSLPEAQLTQALFGPPPAAAPDAQGRILQADGGTLFLDDVGELTLSLHVCMDGIARRLRGARCQRLKVPA